MYSLPLICIYDIELSKGTLPLGLARILCEPSMASLSLKVACDLWVLTIFILLMLLEVGCKEEFRVLWMSMALELCYLCD